MRGDINCNANPDAFCVGPCFPWLEKDQPLNTRTDTETDSTGVTDSE